MQYVIIGAGPAGVTAAEIIRRDDSGGEITLVSDESEPPYARMALPYVLKGAIEPAGTHLRKDPRHYEQLAIRSVAGTVQTVATTEHALVLNDGQKLSYDRLLVATGSTPLRPAIDGLHHDGVHPCWTMADARHIAERATAGSKVVLIGAGFIGCTVLDALAGRGVELTVVELAGQMLPRMLDATAASLVQRWCGRHGMRVLVGDKVVEIGRGNGSPALRVGLAGGEALEASLVVLAAGTRPAVDFLAGSGVEIDEGVLADETMRTNLPGVFAAGDAAQGPTLAGGKRNVHAIQPTAAEHGRIAGINMVGGQAVYQGSLLMNLLDTLGLLSCSLGRSSSGDGDDSCEALDERAGRYLRLLFDGDHLIGAQSVGHGEYLGVLRGLIQSRVSLGPWKQRLLRSPHRVAEAFVSRSFA